MDSDQKAQSWNRQMGLMVRELEKKPAADV